MKLVYLVVLSFQMLFVAVFLLRLLGAVFMLY
jgi:hypothetical protein